MNNEKVCPIMSRPIVEIDGGVIKSTHTTLYTVNCQKGDCALWDSHVLKCGYVAAKEIKLKK